MAWFVILVVQSGYIRSGNIKVHMTLGITGMLIGLGVIKSFLPPAQESKKPARFFPDQQVKLKKEELEKYAGLYLHQTLGYNSNNPTSNYST